MMMASCLSCSKKLQRHWEYDRTFFFAESGNLGGGSWSRSAWAEQLGGWLLVRLLVTCLLVFPKPVPLDQT